MSVVANEVVEGARIVRAVFDLWTADFHSLTARAQVRFEERQWAGGQQDSVDRLALYRPAVSRTIEELRRLLGTEIPRESWRAIKDAFLAAVVTRGDLELALTFFSSVGRRLFDTVGVDPEIEFLDVPAGPIDSHKVVRTFVSSGSTEKLLERVLDAYPFSVPYEDRNRDVRLAAAEIDRVIGAHEEVRLDLAASVFFRNKAAYLVGLIGTPEERRPFVLALLHDDGRSGIMIDAVLLTEDDVSLVFSFTRSYFSVDTARPRELIAFLQSVLPRKTLSDLYMAIGGHRRAKTELYRSLLRHLSSTNEQFDLAPGSRGMVMIVFTMPTSDLVFKVFRDQFDYPKTTTRREVMAKYQLVFEHDRAGRLVDAQEFTDLELDRTRFSDTLLRELQGHATWAIEVRPATVVLRHVYTERRVTPLDLYLCQNDGEAVLRAVLDYGAAVRDLAATNIFPGDLLLKNFGVTRHGRVVFYDYDEISLLTDCRFRRLPAPRNDREELSAGPWFVVNEGDVFPEEFRSFLGLTGPLLDHFLAHHGYLLDPGFWTRMQRRLQAGTVVDIFPYSSLKRLSGGEPAAAGMSEVLNHHA